MGCCGQKRAELKIHAQATNVTQTGTPSWRASQPTSSLSAAATTSHTLIPVRYLERPEFVVRGQSSGREYRFSAAAPVLSVDAHDADALLRSRLFVKAI